MLAVSVRRTIRRYSLVPPGGRVIVAVSGGPDSVALLHLLCDLAKAGDLSVAGVAHFNHQLRPAANDDEQFCRELAAALDLPFEAGRADVRAAAREGKRSIEDAARRLRYAFLHEVAARLTADVIAVGHSRDDQAETFLLRILRGSGTRGLGSIRPKAGMIVRPLIDISRAELRRFAAERGLTFREDETNADVSIPRNRVRHELLPYLERVFTPNIVRVLAREAALAREDDERLQDEAIDLAASIVLRNTHGFSGERSIDSSADRSVLIDAERLRSLHPALASRIARLALGELAGERFVGFDHVQEFLDFVRAGGGGGALSLPGQQALRSGSRVLLSPEPHRLAAKSNEGRPVHRSRRTGEGGSATAEPVSQKPRRSEGGNSFHVLLSIPGEVVLPEQRWMVSADWAGTVTSNVPGDNLAALVKGLDGPLTVRSRRPGDRFRPPGLGGRARKLQDYLVDRKIPRWDRDRLPLVVDRDDRIVWIVGHAVAEGVRANDPSPGVILLKARQLGGEV